jgi:hypothetical protein
MDKMATVQMVMVAMAMAQVAVTETTLVGVTDHENI